MKPFLIPASLGELLDRISILRIKLARITDPEKLKYVDAELKLLMEVLGPVDPYYHYLAKFQELNTIIWDCEKELREPVTHKRIIEFPAYIADRAVLCYKTNDKRFALKAEVNEKFGVELREQKSHETRI